MLARCEDPLHIRTIKNDSRILKDVSCRTFVPDQHFQVQVVLVGVEEDVRELKKDAPLLDAACPNFDVICCRTLARQAFH